VSIWIAFPLIIACALLWDVGIVLQKLAVSVMPGIGADRGLGASLRSLLTSGRWMAGLAASAAGWGLFAFALSFTPVSVARAIQGSGFVILAFFSLFFLGHRLSAREWLGVVLVTAGIVTLGFAQGSAAGAAGRVEPLRLLPVVLGCLLACAAAWLLPWFGLKIRGVIVSAVMAGILLGLGDVATKLLLLLLQQRGPAAAIASAAAGLIVVYISGFLLLSRSYQQGRAILATAVSDLCSRLVAILAGIVALGESLGGSPGMRAAAVAGYTAVLGGAVLLARFTGDQIAEKLSPARGGS
jgi:multidrug transporter EmrE-like cation transporter